MNIERRPVSGGVRLSNDDVRLARVSFVADLYYNHGLNQQEIGETLGIARPAVSRLLSEAKERGIIEIRVHHPWRSGKLEVALRDAFGLNDAVVIVNDGSEHQEMPDLLGRAVQRYLGGHLHPSVTVAISWGSSLHKAVARIDPQRLPNARVVQVIGATGTESHASDGPQLAQMLAAKLGCTAHLLHAPLLVESEALRDALLNDRNIKAVMKVAQEADIALVGIGVPDAEANNLVRTGYLDTSDAERLVRSGAVGDICARYFDENGNVLDVALNRRIVGIEPGEVAKAGTVIAVSGGATKTRAVLAALRGGYLDVLVTDSVVAEYVLNV